MPSVCEAASNACKDYVSKALVLVPTIEQVCLGFIRQFTLACLHRQQQALQLVHDLCSIISYFLFFTGLIHRGCHLEARHIFLDFCVGQRLKSASNASPLAVSHRISRVLRQAGTWTSTAVHYDLHMACVAEGVTLAAAAAANALDATAEESPTVQRAMDAAALLRRAAGVFQFAATTTAELARKRCPREVKIPEMQTPMCEALHALMLAQVSALAHARHLLA